MGSGSFREVSDKLELGVGPGEFRSQRDRHFTETLTGPRETRGTVDTRDRPRHPTTTPRYPTDQSPGTRDTGVSGVTLPGHGAVQVEAVEEGGGVDGRAGEAGPL